MTQSGTQATSLPVPERLALWAGPLPEGGSVAADEVRLLIERAERLLEEKKGISDDIKDLWSEVKGRGHDPRALQDIVKMRAKLPEEQHERQAILEVYLRALGMM